MLFDVAVEKRLGGRRIACSFAADAGLTVLFGPSGAGKTSVLNMIAGLIRPDAGHIRIAGRTLYEEMTEVPVAARRCGYVFQEARLFPHLTVRQNLLYGARGRAIDDSIGFLDLAPLLDRRPATLSGGEARRVAIGRALLSDPAFLLLDEPMSSLDGARREEVMRAIEHLRDGLKLPILLVTHDAGEAERLGRQIVALEQLLGTLVVAPGWLLSRGPTMPEAVKDPVGTAITADASTTFGRLEQPLAMGASN